MNFVALRSEVAACRAWERRLHAGSPATRRAAAMPNRTELWLPLLMPLYGLIGWATGAAFDSEWWIVGIPWWWLASFGRLFPRAVPTEWEALRLPSRRGWLLARWSLRLRGWLWLGACTLGHHFLLGLRDGRSPDGVLGEGAAAILLAPFLFAALVSWFPLQSRALGGRSLAAPTMALVLALVFAGIAVAAWTRRYDKPEKALIAMWGFAAAALVVFLLALPSLRSLRRAAARLSGGTGIGTLLVHGSIGFSGLIAATLLLACLITPSILFNGGGYSIPAVVYDAAIAAAILGTALTAAGALRLVGVADIGIEPRPEVKTAKRAVSAGPAAAVATAGRGLRAAAWALYRGGWRNLQHPWLTFVPRLLYECRAPAFGFVAVGILAAAGGMGGFRGILGAWIVPLALAFIPRPLHLPASRRLHLLGADFGAVAVHNLRWGVLLEVLPAALGGALVFLPWMEKVPFGLRVGGFLASIAVLLLRQGPGISPFVDIARWLGLWPSVAVAGAAAAGWFLAPAATLLVGGTALFAVAAEASIRTLRDPQAAGRRIEARAADD